MNFNPSFGSIHYQPKGGRSLWNEYKSVNKKYLELQSKFEARDAMVIHLAADRDKLATQIKQLKNEMGELRKKMEAAQHR